MSCNLIKVTPSPFKGIFHVDILRPVTREDFDFVLEVKELDSSIRPGVQAGLTGNLKEPCRVMIRDAFIGMDTGPHWDDCRTRDSLLRGVFEHQAFHSNYMGCRDDESRKRRLDRDLVRLKAEAWASRATLEDKAVVSFNRLLQEVCSMANFIYKRHMEDILLGFSLLDNEEVEGMPELNAELVECQNKVDELVRKMQVLRCQYMLAKMERDGWRLQGCPLTPELAAKVKAEYTDHKAFHNPLVIIS